MIYHMRAIVWHLRNGEDNAGLSREALANYLEAYERERDVAFFEREASDASIRLLKHAKGKKDDS